ncbi:Gfo/Idh/MocA family protein [Falsibacillus pallidus]|uniref:Putative dehydrogenase n=1 Tax=Falsibacillus pallidus TaxID=493781 RepID=A0A370H1S5_9BACI|nr:Gfo/Idh/MocA family oxidoreductase [Falsibacillus pallidus]RDI47993.1 putative dehydrogenase [Falsibacillus pallidus]
MSKIKVGVIGCGSIATHRHIPEYANHPAVELAAFCDIQVERAEYHAGKYEAKAYSNYEDLLKDTDIQAVSVCTPNYLHAPITVAALKAGKHVLCEKPMAVSNEEADSMIAAAKESGKKLMIGHNQRFVRSHQKAKDLIASGDIGKVYSFRTAFGHGGPEGWSVDGKDSWFFKKEEASIGAMGDLGVHKTDLLRYLLDAEIVEVSGFADTLAKEATVDDNAVCILKTDTGIIGTLAASWSYTAGEDNSTIIYGEKGIIRLEDDPNYSLIVQYKNGETVRYELGKIQSNDEGGQQSSGVINHFIDAIIHDKDVLIPGEEGKKSLAVILAAMESSLTGKHVKLND